MQEDPNSLRQCIMGFRTTQLVYVAAKLGLADLLAQEARTATDLAAAPKSNRAPCTGFCARWPAWAFSPSRTAGCLQ